MTLKLIFEAEGCAGFNIGEIRDVKRRFYADEIRSLCLWELVRPLDGTDGSFFVITQKGLDFLNGKIRLKRFLLKNNELIRSFGREIDVRDFRFKKWWQLPADLGMRFVLGNEKPLPRFIQRARRFLFARLKRVMEPFV